MLTKKDIRIILARLQLEEVVKIDDKYIVMRHTFGYSNAPDIGALQAKLSAMLEATK